MDGNILLYTCGTGRRSGSRKPVNNLLLWILFWAMRVKNEWPPRSQSACSQVSTVLFYVWTAKFMWAQVHVDYMCVSLLQAKGRQHHLSQNIGLAIVGSARPAPPARCERNECIKETVPLKLFKFQSSNFNSCNQYNSFQEYNLWNQYNPCNHNQHWKFQGCCHTEKWHMCT